MARFAPAAPEHAARLLQDLLAVAPGVEQLQRLLGAGPEDDVDVAELDDGHQRAPARRSGRLQDPVEDDRQDDDRQPRLEAHGDVDRVQRPHHRLAEAVRADERRDHHHGQAEQDALRDAGHDGRQRVGQLDLPQELAAGGPEGLARLDQGLGHRRDAEMGEADRGRHREDHGGDQARHDAEAEQDQRRDQVDEGRDGLHQVEDRAHHGEEPGPVRGEDAEGHADDDAGRGGEEDERQGLDRRAPVAEIGDEEQRQHDEEGELPGAVQGVDRPRQEHDEQERRHQEQALREAVDEERQAGREGVEEALGVLVQEIDAVAHPLAERDLVGRNPLFHRRLLT